MNTRRSRYRTQLSSSSNGSHARGVRGFRAASAVLALAGTLVTQACVQAEVTIPDMQVTRQDLSIQPAPANTPAGMETTVVQQFKYEKTPTPLPKSVTSKMHAIDVTITLKHGATDLSFIHGATLVVTEPGGKAETVLDYQPTGGEPSGKSILIPLLSSPEALNPWSVDSATFELTVTGILPAQAWYLDVTLSYAGSVTYSS